MAPGRSCLKFRIPNAFRSPLAIFGVAALATAILLLTYLSFDPSSSLPLVPYAFNSDNNITVTESAVYSAPTSKVKTLGWEETMVPNGAHIHGFTVLDNIYLRNGTFYVVTDNGASFPPRNRLSLGRHNKSNTVKIGEGDTEPTDGQLQFIIPDDVTRILGEHLTRIEGFSVIVYDHSQFMKHFYHWFGEIILGAWWVYSHIVLLVTGSQTLPPLALPLALYSPCTYWSPYQLCHFISNDEWRDSLLMRAAFPGAAIEQAPYWNNLQKIETTVVIKRVMLVSRISVHRHPFGWVWFKMIAGTMNAPVCASLWQNILAPGFTPNTLQDPSRLPLVTYISRQGSGHRLVAADHDALVAALKELEAEGICEVQVAAMERMSAMEQTELVARSTHQLWIPLARRSTTIEIFVLNGILQLGMDT
ncbi:hypothetical protein K438DRAFT_1829329, partial [Mycena galopus ATCC 62051]